MLSTCTMANELLNTRTRTMLLLSIRTMAEDGDKHKNNANEVAKNKNDAK